MLRKEASALVERVDVLKSELDDSVKAQQAIREKLVTETSVWTTKVCGSSNRATNTYSHMYV